MSLLSWGCSLGFCSWVEGVLVSCDQAALWMVLSVCPSVTLFSLCSHHRIIMKFSGVITNDRSEIHAKGQGQRSRSQRSKPNLAVSGPLLQFKFTYVTEIMHKAWWCLGEVPYCFSRSSVKFQGHAAQKIIDFDPNWAFLDCNSSLNSPMATKWCAKHEVA